MKSRSRRRFIGSTAAGIGALLLPSLAQGAEVSIQPAAFEVTADGALLWVAGEGTVAFEISTDDKFSSPVKVEVPPLSRDAGGTATVEVKGLPPDTVHAFRVVDAQSGKVLSKPGRFRTAPVKPRRFSFVWTADMEESYKPFRLFDRMAVRDPEFFLHLGDTIYADHPKAQFNPSVAHYRRKHAANRRDQHCQDFLLRCPTYAIWDDHETDNNAHGGHPQMPAGRQVFREYWPCRAVASDGLYRQFQWAGVDFFVLDTRSYRSPHAAPEGASKSMLGQAQKEWFLESLGKSTAPLKFVLTSVPFQGGGVDTWVTYRTERNEISAFIREKNVGGVVFLTGDYHLARDWSNPKAAFREFMAGPIASFTHYRETPAARDRYEKAGTFHYGDGYNFGLFTVDPEKKTATVEYIDADGKSMRSIEFTV